MKGCPAWGDEMEIYPVAITQGDLQTLIRVCNDVLGQSPTRGLDQCHLKKTDPAAFLSVLTMDNKPLDTLRHGGKESSIFQHYSISFIAVVDAEILIELQNKTKLHIYSRKGRKAYVALLSGTVDVWYHAIEGRFTGSPEFEELFTKALSLINRVGFREVFGGL